MKAPIVTIPEPGRAAYHPERPLTRNPLIAAQVKHFEEAEKNLPPELQTGIDVNSIRTEGQASDYVRRVTEAIHKSGGRVARVRKAT